MAFERNMSNTIYQLKPDPQTECYPDVLVYDAAKLMVKERSHCVLVKGNDDSIVGLFTAKDLAYRVVGRELDPKKTTVREIMTTTPLCLHIDAPITTALETMVQKGVRHLPLLDDSGSIKGVLDITRCFHQAMLRLERISANAQKLNGILSNVAENYEDQHTVEAQRIVDDIAKLNDLLNVPTLKSFANKINPPVFIDSSDNVLHAAKLMVQKERTALLVRDRTSSSRKTIGIFTSKDIVTRVLAKGYDPATCTVARVLTTSPEFAKCSMTISTALRTMYQGHFLNLPVLDDDSKEIIGVLSVLQLTYAALSQLGKKDVFDRESFDQTTLEEVTSRLSEDSSAVWDVFWKSLKKSSDDIQSLESSFGKSPVHSRSHTPRAQTPISRSRRPSTLHAGLSRRSSFNRRLSSELQALSDLSQVPIKRNTSSESLNRTSYYIQRKTVNFKIKHKSNRVHKITMTVIDDASIYDDIKLFDLLKEEIANKVGIDMDMHSILYYDEDEDLVTIMNEEDLTEAIRIASETSSGTVEILVQENQKGDSLWDSIYQFFHFSRWKLSDDSNENSSILKGALLVLSLGILLGFSFTKRKLFYYSG